MASLDVAPMITALRTSPEEFEIAQGDWLCHTPSAHNFQLDGEGNVKIAARCDCSLMDVSRKQGAELWQAFQQWQVSYWTPLQINKEFASHFRPRSRLRRFLICLTAELHSALVNGGRAPDHELHQGTAVPAE